MNKVYYVAMKEVNIADIKNRFSYFVSMVEEGEEIGICKRNVPVAKMVPIQKAKNNETKLGCGKGTVIFTDTDLTEPFIPENEWEML